MLMSLLILIPAVPAVAAIMGEELTLLVVALWTCWLREPSDSAPGSISFEWIPRSVVVPSPSVPLMTPYERQVAVPL